MNKKTCICILGMHRGGTSAMAGVINKLGIYMGENLMGPSATENAKGFFELIEFKELNKEILAYFKTRWDDINIVKKIKNLLPDELRYKMRSLIRKNFAEHDIFAIKDPRMCLLFPLWKTILENAGVNIKVQIIIRNPNEVFLSLLNRNNKTLQEAFQLWHIYMAYAEFNTRGLPRHFMMFNDLLCKTEESIFKMIDVLNLNVDYKIYKNDVIDFLDIKLKHFDTEKSLSFYQKLKKEYEIRG